MFYKSLIRSFLFQISKKDPEIAHELFIKMSKELNNPWITNRLNELFRVKDEYYRLFQTIKGIRFSNPVGMAAGFDKTGELASFLQYMGFGFVESGTFTPKYQSGNIRPRIKRLPDQNSLISKMGFNNPGILTGLDNLASYPINCPLGVNIGKQRDTKLEDAHSDYLECISKSKNYYPAYYVINISSLNTPELRKLQNKSYLMGLLNNCMNSIKGTSSRLFVKLPPDLGFKKIGEILDILMELKVHGVIVSNTQFTDEGGFSGPGLHLPKLKTIYRIRKETKGKLTIVGVGGIQSGDYALQTIMLGANLIQIYTGYIYEGPFLPKRINKYLLNFCERENTNISELVGVSIKM